MLVKTLYMYYLNMNFINKLLTTKRTKHTLFLFFILSFCSCRQSNLAVKKVVGNNVLASDIKQIKYPLDIKPAISAHRGGKYIIGYPENCLETFKHITKEYTMIIECDVAQTKDGKLIFMHDDAIDRTTTGSGKVTNLNWPEIRSTNLKDHTGRLTDFKVSTLEEVLSWAKGNAILSLDIKRSVDREKLISLLDKYEAHTYSEIITYSYDAAQYYAENAPKYTLSVGIRNMEELNRYLNSDMDIANLKPFVGTRRKDASFYEKLHRRGMIVTLGTLGNIDEQAKARGYKIYEKLIAEGVDVFATDYPLEVAEYFYKMEKDN